MPRSVSVETKPDPRASPSRLQASGADSMEKGFVKLRFNVGQGEALGCEVDDDRFEPVAPARCLVPLPVVRASLRLPQWPWPVRRSGLTTG
jgi:hypothetical protein